MVLAIGWLRTRTVSTLGVLVVVQFVLGVGNPAFRRVHRRLTWMWVGGLSAQAVLALVVIYAAPLTAAVVITNVLTPAVLLTLIALTEARDRAVDRVPAH